MVKKSQAPEGRSSPTRVSDGAELLSAVHSDASPWTPVPQSLAPQSPVLVSRPPLENGPCQPFVRVEHPTRIALVARLVCVESR